MTTEEILLQIVGSLTKTNEEQSRQIAGLTAELKKISAQIVWFQRQMYGRKSESHIAIDSQPSLFDQVDMDHIPNQARFQSPKKRKPPDLYTQERTERLCQSP